MERKSVEWNSPESKSSEWSEGAKSIEACTGTCQSSCSPSPCTCETRSSCEWAKATESAKTAKSARSETGKSSAEREKRSWSEESSAKSASERPSSKRAAPKGACPCRCSAEAKTTIKEVVAEEAVEAKIVEATSERTPEAETIVKG